MEHLAAREAEPVHAHITEAFEYFTAELRQSLGQSGLGVVSLRDLSLSNAEQLQRALHKYPLRPALAGLQRQMAGEGLTPIAELRGDGGENPILIAVRVTDEEITEQRSAQLAAKVLGRAISTLEGRVNLDALQFLPLKTPDYELLTRQSHHGTAEVTEAVEQDMNARQHYYRVAELAVQRGASDIHIEPSDDGYQIRYRIKGELVGAPRKLDRKTGTALIAVVKSSAEMDIAEKRKNQDGSIVFSDEETRAHQSLKGISFRAAVMPTVRGEKAVLRLLKSGLSADYDLDQLGFPATLARTLHQELDSPHGLILVTGPTGSGKTTTLYSMLKYLNRPERNIVTIEDPVEIYLPGVNQQQVNSAINVNFAAALKGFMRQDPNVILVGEIRDPETAEVALQAANTGHLVLSTLHTNDSVSSVARLEDLGVSRAHLRDNLRMVISQRLVRHIDPQATESYDAATELNDLFGERVITAPVPMVRPKATLTAADRHAAYHGRLLVPEVWMVGEKERDLIVAGNLSHDALLHAAEEGGMRSLLTFGLSAALEGKTTLEELRKHVFTPTELRRNRKAVEQLLNSRAG